MTDVVPLSDQVNLVYNTVRNQQEVAADSYKVAKYQLDRLADYAVSLPWSAVAVDIGAQARIGWGAPVSQALADPGVAWGGGVDAGAGDIALSETASVSSTAAATPQWGAGIAADLGTGTHAWTAEVDSDVKDAESRWRSAVPIQPNIDGAQWGSGIAGDTADIGLEWSSIDAPDAPDEPDYTGLAPTQAKLEEVTKPSALAVAAPTVWAPDLSGEPERLATDPELPPVPQIAPLPELAAVVPIVDRTALTGEFRFDEPIYTERVTPQIQAEIQRVLSGGMGLPQSYWDGLWAQASGDLARQTTGRLRQARNRGAASFWPLPGETVLASSRAIQDEGARAAQLVRLEQAKQQAVFAREDFWQAIGQGLAFEKLWLDAHQQIAGRALAAAEQLVGLNIQIYNANSARYNWQIESARIAGTLDELAQNRVLRTFEAQMRADAAELDRARHAVERSQAQWTAWGAKGGLSISNMAEQVRRWNGIVDADQRYEALRQTRNQVLVSDYSARLGKIDALSRATAAVLGARTGVRQLALSASVAGHEAASREVSALLDRGRLALGVQQAAHEAAARENADTLERGRLALSAAVAADESDGRRNTLAMDLARLRQAAQVAAHEAEARELSLAQDRERLRLSAQIADDEAYARRNGLALDLARLNVTAQTAQAEIERGLNASRLDRGRLRIAAQTGSDEAYARRNTVALERARLELARATASDESYARRNAVEVDLARLVQAAQQAKAQLSIAQAEWVKEHEGTTIKALADLAYGYAQAAATAADVSFGRSIDYNYNESASHNSSIKW